MLRCLTVIFIFTFATLDAQVRISGGNKTDLGTIYNTTKPIERTVVLTNDGSSAIRIKEVHTSCGCTVATLSDSNLAPGKKVGIKIRFNPMGYMGKVTKSVYIFTSDTSQQMLTVTLTGTIATLIQSSPSYVDFRQRTDSTHVMLTNVSHSRIQVDGIESELGDFRISPRRFTLEAGKSISVSIKRLEPTKREMSHYVDVMTSSKLQRVVRISVFRGLISE